MKKEIEDVDSFTNDYFGPNEEQIITKDFITELAKDLHSTIFCAVIIIICAMFFMMR
ncbi:MAG: hypothetical protein Q8936_14150 [Bacillota bacterium]|nr:hypothetical protein [Bacillota bacterium]